MSWQRSKLVIFFSLKWLNRTLFIPLLMLSVILGVLLFSAPGLKFNLWLAQQWLPGFSVGSSEGSLLGGNTLQNLQWQQSDNSISVKQLSLQFDNYCLLKLTLCAEQLNINGLVVSWQNASSRTETAQPDAALLLPLPVSIKQLTLNDGRINLHGNQLQWQHLSLGVSAWGNKLQLVAPLWRQVSLTLATQPSQTGNDNVQYTPPKLSDFSAPLQLYVDRFKLQDIHVVQQQQQYQLHEAHISLQWQNDELNLMQFDLNHALGTLQSSALLHTRSNYPLDANLTAQITAGEFAGQQFTLRAGGNLSALELLLSATGKVALNAQATLDVLSPALPHQLQLSSDLLQWPPVSIDNQQALVSLQDTQLSVTGTLTHSEVKGHFSLMTEHAPPMAITLDGAVNQHSLTLSTLHIATLGGRIESPLSLNWQQGLRWQANTSLYSVKPGVFWPDYQGELNGALQHQGSLNSDSSWQLELQHIDISGQLRDYLLTLTGSGVAADPDGSGQYRFHTPGLVLRHGDNSLQLTGELANDWRAAVQLSITDLAASVANASGALSGTLSLEGPWHEPQLKADISGNRLRFNQASLAAIKLEGVLHVDHKQQWQTNLTLTAEDGHYQQQTLKTLLLQLDGSTQQHQLALTLDTTEHQAQLNVQGQLTDDRWHGILLQGQINSLPGNWHLAEPTHVTAELTSKKLTVAEHCWQQDSASLCLVSPLRISQTDVNLGLVVNQLQLPQLSALLPAGNSLRGSVDIHAQINWQASKPVTAELTLTSATGAYSQQFSSPMTLAWQSVHWQLGISDNTMQNQLAVRFNQSATLDAEVNIANLQGDIKPLSGAVSLNQFAIDFLQPVLGELNELSGVVSSKLQLAGTLQQPLLYGEMNLQRSRLKGKLAPVDIDNADVLLTLNGDNAKLDGQVRTPKGEVNLQGNASWQKADSWRAELKVKGDELRLQVPQASLQIAPDVTLTLAPGYTKVSGSVQIPTANISIDSLPESAVELSDDLVLLDAELQPLPTQNKTLFAMESDINLQLGNKVKLSAFGLKTRLTGNLRVRQLVEQPLRLNGEVKLQDGIFRAYGQDLLIRKGSMTFNGPADQPYLNVEAIRNPDNMEDNVIAGIRVNGPADDPSVVIFSEPAKAQANALAYLLMGRDLETGAGDAGNAVTTSLIGMTLSSGSKVVGEIGEAFGLQDLTLDTAGAGDNSKVTVSGYLSRDIQLKYGYGIFNAVGEFTLRYRLMRRLYLEAVSGLDNAVDLLYKFEFD